MGDTRRGDEIVDARVVVPALDEHRASRCEQRVERAVAGGVRIYRAVVPEDGEHLRAGLDGARWRSVRRVHVHVGIQTEQGAMQDVGERDLDAFARIAIGYDGPEHPGDVERVVEALEEQPDDRIELPARQRRRRQPRVDPRDRLFTRALRDGREDIVGLQCVEDRLVTRVDLGVARNPCAHRVPTFTVGRERIEGLGRGAHLPCHLTRQLPEHVFLAGEVLVEGDPRAAGEVRDPIDAAPVVALFTEGAQRRVEDALLRALPAGSDPRVVGERRAPDDRDGAVGATISLVVAHARAPQAGDQTLR